MTKKGTAALLAVLVSCLLLMSGYFLGRKSSRGVRVSADGGLPDRSVPGFSEAAETSAETELQRTADELLDINTATLEQLIALPQIGETIAQRIIDYRTEHGPFTGISDLLNVQGIGEGRLEAIKDYITVR